MTKQEETREGIKRISCRWCEQLPYCEESCGVPELDLAKLSELGVVIKVGEVSENMAQTASEGDKYLAAGNGMFLMSSERTSHIFKNFRDMGYVAVVPLV